MVLKLNIACDDVNPLKGYRILGDKTETWFRKLNEDYGVKFTLFIPSNYHNRAPLSQNKEWIQELNSIDWLELAAHGHFHMTSDPQRFGECEFLELQETKEISDRITAMWNEWIDVDIFPEGWRNPGWLCSSESHRQLNNDIFIIRKFQKFKDDNFRTCGPLHFEYAAVHYEHNQGLNWNCKTFFGHDGIQQQTIGIHNDDMIMFQSHISGKHNHNVWNEQNYEQLRLSLDHLFQNYQIEPKILKECLNGLKN